MPSLHRALIKTHHLTSRRKIRLLASAAKLHHCSVILKSGRPPGVMIAECDTEEGLVGWVGVVKALRYKFYNLLYLGEVAEGRLGQERGTVREVGEMKALRGYVEECGMAGWWVESMRFL